LRFLWRQACRLRFLRIDALGQPAELTLTLGLKTADDLDSTSAKGNQ